MSKGMCVEFFRDLKGVIYDGDYGHPDSGIMSVGMIADYMRISVERANRFLRACANYGITERQGGGWVI